MLVAAAAVLVVTTLADLVGSRGFPGAGWSHQELLITKAKLWRMFSPGEAWRILLEGTPASPAGNGGSVYQDYAGVLKTVGPKALRQGFHDCLLYEDGSGGCDGCLSQRNMWHQWQPRDQEGHMDRPDQTGGDNNGMQAVSDILEGIYRWADWPARTPALSTSLRDSGKSRADLWALAAMTAVEFGFATNNAACSGDQNLTLQFSSESPCSQRAGEPDCAVRPERGFTFRAGRRDCELEPAGQDRPYWHDRHEVHPNPHGNGEITMEFFRSQFNLTSREEACPDCSHPENSNYGGSACCDNLPPGQACNPDCVDWRLVSGNDETMLNCDMGLYRQFQLEDGWRTAGCPGLERFNFTQWSQRFLLPHYNQEIRVLANTSLCLRAVADPTGSNDSSPVGVEVVECGDTRRPALLSRWEREESSGLVSLAARPGWNLCALHRNLTTGLKLVLREHAWQGCHWSYDAFHGLLSSSEAGQESWCLGREGSEVVVLPCAAPADTVQWGDWWYCPDHITEFSCPLQTLSHPPASQPMHAVVEEFALYQDVWASEFIAVLEKVVENGYRRDELGPGVDMSDWSCYLPGQTANQDWLCTHP